jgi:hypothetical protein
MGWFSRGNEQPAQQFGTPNMGAGMTGNAMMGMGGAGMMGNDMAMMQMAQQQNPMLQQMANDPVVATARLLELRDPIAAFMMTQNMALLLDLIGDVVTLSMKEFMSTVKFKVDGDYYVLDQTSLGQFSTMSPENLNLTLTRLQSAAQQTLAMNQQQRQFFLQAHTMGGGATQQSGFFGNLIGSALGNQIQNGNAANMMKAGAGLVI